MEELCQSEAAYYQELLDSVQILDGLGIVRKRMRIKELIDERKYYNRCRFYYIERK